MRIPDPIEQGEVRCEDWAVENVVGENFICECGQQCKLDDGILLTANPYGIPVCGDCAMKDPSYARWIAEGKQS